MSVAGKRQSKARILGVKSSSSAKSVGEVQSRRKGSVGDGPPPLRSKSTHSKPSRPYKRTFTQPQNGSSSSQTKRETTPVSGAFLQNGRRPGVRGNSASKLTVKEVIAQQIRQAKNIVVMTGAGISTGSGIPDFRSPGTGLYDNLKQYRIPYPEAIFDLDYFEGNPRPFFTLAKELYPGKFCPNLVHYFLRLLHEKGCLLRIYTQNIDGLERTVGLPPQKLVEAHGNFLSASCVACGASHPPQDVKNTIYRDQIPRCRHPYCSGLVKPDIVFFGEDLPRRFLYHLKDFPQADLLLVMGTSLEVEPFASIVNSVRHFIPRILFNRVPVGPFNPKRRMNDTVVTGDLETNISELISILGWESELSHIREQNSPPCQVSDVFSRLAITDDSSQSSKPPPHPPHPPLLRPTVSNSRLLPSGDSARRQRRVDFIRRRVPVSEGPSTLPRVTPQHKHTVFHAQRSLYQRRHDNVTDSESSSEDSGSSSDSEDD